MHDSDGRPCSLNQIDAADVSVPHLESHVEIFTIDATDSVKILIEYSCHCWSRNFDPIADEGQIQFLDNKRPRVFDPERYKASTELNLLLKELPTHRIFVTKSDRNYGCYNAQLTDANGFFYTAYFTLRRDKGRFNGIRHSLRLFVESAYAKGQPEAGHKTSFKAVVGKARKGQMVKYRR